MAAKKILIFAPYGAWMVHHQLDAVIGAGLAAQGSEVLILGCDGILENCIIAGNPRNSDTCANCARAGGSLFRSLGLPLLQLGKIATREDHEAAAQAFRSSQGAALGDFVYEGKPLGEWSLASMQGYFFTGDLDPRKDRFSEPMRSQFANGVLLIRVLSRLMDEFRPDHLFCYNSIHYYYRIAFELARERNIPVLVHERGLPNDSFGLLDSESMSSNEGRFRSWEPWKNVPLTAEECLEIKGYFQEREEGKNSFSKFHDFKTEGEDIRHALRIPKGGRIVAMFPSGDREIGAFESTQTKTFSSQVEWIRATAEICVKHDLYLVIRHHPSNVQKNLVNHPFLGRLLALARELPDRVRVIMPHENIVSYSLIWNADLAITYFSTMGSETVVRALAGICVGNSLYRPMGVEWVESPQAYEKAILSGLERTRNFGAAELARAYRFAHYLVFKLGYTFKSFGIRDTHAPDIRFRGVSELMPGNDPVYDRVCDHVLKGTSLHPVPDSSHRERSDSEERAFLETELAHLRARRGREEPQSRPDRGLPVLTVFAADTRGASAARWKSSLARSREKSLQVLPLALADEFAGTLAAIRKALGATVGRYVYLGGIGTEPDESVFSASVDFLDKPENAEFHSVRWGAWLMDEAGGLQGELFTDARSVATFDEALALWPALEEPMAIFPLQVMRTEFLRELCDWLDAMSGFAPRDIAASLFGLFHGEKSESSVKRFNVPMVVLHPLDASPAAHESPVASNEPVAMEPAATGKSPAEREDELNAHAIALGKDPSDRKALIGCIHSLTSLGDAFNARRVIGLFLQAYPKDDEVRSLLDGVEWNSRKGRAALAEWKLRGEGYARLRTGRPFDTFAEAERYVDSVPGWMLEGQEKFLFEKVKSLPDGAVILEMGADRGRSTSAMALACVGTRKRIFSIDTFAGNSGLMGMNTDYYREWFGNLERLGLDGYVTGLQGYTFDVLPTWNTPVDFTFIDASHEYLDVLNDLRLIYPFVKDGGWIAFHDVEPGWPGPWRVWLEYGIPLLTDHQVVHTLACGKKTKAAAFGKKPESIPRFSFARKWVEELERTRDPEAARLLPALRASLDFAHSDDKGKTRARNCESALAAMPPSMKQTIRSMLSKDAFLDGYLHYWNGLTLEAEGNRGEAEKAFSLAAGVSYGVPLEQLQGRTLSAAERSIDPAVSLFAPHLSPGCTVVQAGSGNGQLLQALPGLLKLGLETDEEARKRASLGAGIDSFTDVSELPTAFADAVVGHDCLAITAEPMALLRGLRRLLHPKGKAVFTTALPDPGAASGAEKALYAWTPSAFGNLFKAAGFTVTKTEVIEVAGGPMIRLLAGCEPTAPTTDQSRDWAMVGSPLPKASAEGNTDPRDIPVALVVYKRSEHTRKVLEALEKSQVRNLYVFCDGAKGNGDEVDVRRTRALIESIGWVRPEIHRVESNRGLAQSVMAATDHVLSRHETVVLLEDDCVPQAHFFDFMAKALDKYREDPRVFGVSGYTVPMQRELLDRYPFDAYFCPRISSWGWATWRRAWEGLDRDLVSACKKALAANIDLDQGGNDIRFSIEGMLTGHVKDVWTLPWVLSVYANRGCFVYPTVSHIDNIGMDGSGVHCGATEKYRTALSDCAATRFPDKIALDAEIMARFRSFYDLNLQRG